MAKESAIGWTDATFNGWIGCTEVGLPGHSACDFCYARDLDARYQWGVPPEQRVKGVAPHWGDDAPRFRTSASNWRGPIKWNEDAKAAGRPIKVFAFSLADVFDKHEQVIPWRAEFWALVRATPFLRWIIVTKRTPLIPKMLPGDWGSGYPNVGLVATVVTQEEFNRDAGRLLKIPARWHGFSIEPQLGRIIIPGSLATYPGSIWLITGGESRQQAGTARAEQTRPYDIDWARGLITATKYASNLYVYVKQTGEHPIGCDPPQDGMGKDPAAWPADIRVHEFPPELLS